MSLVLVHTTNPATTKAQKVLVVAAFAEVNVTSRHITVGVENEEASYLRRCHPLGRLPVLQTDEGYLFESNAIVRFIAHHDKSNTFLYGRTPFEASQVDMWLDFATTELDTIGINFIMNLFRGAEVPADQDTKASDALTGLEAWLETRTYLVGERLS
ncbi:glutathione S-transferase, putative, partial [Bodo saltans]